MLPFWKYSSLIMKVTPLATNKNICSRKTNLNKIWFLEIIEKEIHITSNSRKDLDIIICLLKEQTLLLELLRAQSYPKNLSHIKRFKLNH